MHLIKSALFLILFACLPFSASAAPAAAKPPVVATTPTEAGGQYQYGRRGDAGAWVERRRRGQGQGDRRIPNGSWSVRFAGSVAGSEGRGTGVAGEEPGADRHRVKRPKRKEIRSL